MKNKENRIITGRISVNNGKSVCVKEKKPSSGTGLHRRDGALLTKQPKDGDIKTKEKEQKPKKGGVGPRGGKRP